MFAFFCFFFFFFFVVVVVVVVVVVLFFLGAAGLARMPTATGPRPPTGSKAAAGLLLLLCSVFVCFLQFCFLFSLLSVCSLPSLLCALFSVLSVCFISSLSGQVFAPLDTAVQVDYRPVTQQGQKRGQ